MYHVPLRVWSPRAVARISLMIAVLVAGSLSLVAASAPSAPTAAKLKVAQLEFPPSARGSGRAGRGRVRHADASFGERIPVRAQRPAARVHAGHLALEKIQNLFRPISDGCCVESFPSGRCAATGSTTTRSSMTARAAARSGSLPASSPSAFSPERRSSSSGPTASASCARPRRSSRAPARRTSRSESRRWAIRLGRKPSRSLRIDRSGCSTSCNKRLLVWPPGQPNAPRAWSRFPRRHQWLGPSDFALGPAGSLYVSVAGALG